MVMEDSAAESSQPKDIRAGQRLLISGGLRRRDQEFPLGFRSTVFEYLPCQQTRAGSLWGKAEMVRAASHDEGHIGEQHTERGPTVTRNPQINARRQE